MSAYIDWDVYGTTNIDRYQTSIGVREMNLNASATNETGQTAVSGIPLVGTGTMRMRCQSGPLLLIPTYPGETATERGLVAGKIRTIIRWNDLGGVSRFGLIAMQSALDLVGGSGDAYVCVFDTLSFNNIIRIGKMSSTTIGNWTTKASSASGQFSDDTSLAVEFEWDASSGVNCLMAVRTGSAINFSNLTTLISYDDTSSPLLSSVAEGLWGNRASGNVDVYWDSTTIYKRTT